jgi:hypothetical protein
LEGTRLHWFGCIGSQHNLGPAAAPCLPCCDLSDSRTTACWCALTQLLQGRQGALQQQRGGWRWSWMHRFCCHCQVWAALPLPAARGDPLPVLAPLPSPKTRRFQDAPFGSTAPSPTASPWAGGASPPSTGPSPKSKWTASRARCVGTQRGAVEWGSCLQAELSLSCNATLPNASPADLPNQGQGCERAQPEQR